MDVMMYGAETGASANRQTAKTLSAANDNEVCTARRWVPKPV